MSYLFIHSYTDEHLGHFHILAIFNNAAMTIFVQICVGVPVFICLGYIPRRKMAGSNLGVFQPLFI